MSRSHAYIHVAWIFLEQEKQIALTAIDCQAAADKGFDLLHPDLRRERERRSNGL